MESNDCGKMFQRGSTMHAVKATYPIASTKMLLNSVYRIIATQHHLVLNPIQAEDSAISCEKGPVSLV